MKNKKENKKEFYLAHNIKGSKAKPLVLIDISNNECSWTSQMAEGISSLNVNVAVITNSKTTTQNPNAVTIQKAADITSAYRAADFVILPKSNMAKLMKAWSNEVAPICLESEQARDYNPIKETGNAFIVASDNEWGFFAGLVRGLETYKFPYDWSHLISQCKKSL